MADYLLYTLNKSSPKVRQLYVDRFRLNGPTNDIGEVLTHIASSQGFIVGGASSRRAQGVGFKSIRAGELDLERAATVFITAFRKGEIGIVTLDDCSPAAVQLWLDGEQRQGIVQASEEDLLQM